MKDLRKFCYRLKSLNYQIISEEAASVNGTSITRSDWLFLNKIWNFVVFCDSLKWLTACMIEVQWLLNKTGVSAVFNFKEDDVDFFDFFTATVNLYAFVFSRNYSDLKFISCLLLHFFCMFFSSCIVYFHEYIYHLPFYPSH